MSQSVEIKVPEVDDTVRSPTDALRFVTAMLVATGTFFAVIVFPDIFGGLGLGLDTIFENPSGAGAEIAELVLTAIVLLLPAILVVTFVWRREPSPPCNRRTRGSRRLLRRRG